jgi:hypothetical protein
MCRHFVILLLVKFLAAAAAAFPAAAAEPPVRTEVNVVAEISFQARDSHDDPFNDITLDVVFTAPNGQSQRVPAFWAGGDSWKVRYASPQVGTYNFRSECSQESDVGLHRVSGSVEVVEYKGKNPLYVHGPIQIAADKRHFEHADGTPFLWLADTWWMGLCNRLHWPDEVKALARDRRQKGYNVIQIVAGLYPDMHPFDPRGANEAGFPWEENYARIWPDYFDAADKRLRYLNEEGFTPCIVGAWGYFMPWMGVDKAKQHWRYLIARYGAMPVVWCAAGEANLPWYLAKGFPYDDRKQVAQWTEVLRYIRETDPFRRPLTIHPTGIGRLSARNCTEDAALLDFDILQTPHGQREAVAPTVNTVRASYADKPTMPVIDGEAAYEMLGDRLPTQWTRQMFWLCMTNGAAGHTYGANGIWQCNRKEMPHGPSPHHAADSVGYGKIPWDEAMNLPGSQQIGLGKKLFERFAWYKFEPRADWAEYAAADASWQPRWGQWIWFPEGDSRVDAPVGKRYFRRTFELPSSDAVKRATLWLSVDDRFVVYVNAQRIGEFVGSNAYKAFDVANALRAGRNVVAVEGENLPAPVAANPAGLLASLRIQTAAGKEIEVASSHDWRCSKNLDADSNWTSAGFDDKTWTSAEEVGPFGTAPWGRLETTDTYGPYATGVAGRVRIIYAPQSQAVRVLKVEPDVRYEAEAFDPVSGETTRLGPVVPDAQSTWTARRPADKSASDDWVLILKASNP